MSIPDPTIDPITGLPILDTSGIVQQIPLGYQTTDFASWNATAHPTRTPLFPDDGYPMFSNVQGQHPLTGNAQSVETDGNHRLKVATDSTGGGNGPVSIHAMQLSQSVSGGGTTDLGPIGTLGSVIYGLSFSWTFDAGAVRSSGKNAYVRLLIPGQSVANDSLILASIAISIPASGTTDRIAGEVHEWYDRGMIFPYAYDYGDGQYHLIFEAVNIGDGNMSLGVWMSV